MKMSAMEAAGMSDQLSFPSFTRSASSIDTTGIASSIESTCAAAIRTALWRTFSTFLG